MSTIRPFQSLEACFGDLPDPRVVGRCEHRLVELIMVAVCAVLCGAESWSEVAEFGEAKQAWLKQYLKRPAGIPSHDTFARVYRERHLPDRIQAETAYFLSSLPADAQRILDATRAHWSVENTFHWTLDVTFAEDTSRVRLDNAPENFAVLCHVALNLLKRHPSKASLKRKRFRAALDVPSCLNCLPKFDAITLP